MRRVLAAICPDTLRPLDKAEVYRRAARRAAIAAEQQRVAKSSEAYLPPEQQRQVIDLTELRAVIVECAMVLPFAALATVAWFAANIP